MIRQPFSLGGIIPVAGFIRDKNHFARNHNINSKDTFVLLIHGENDNIINCKESKIAYELFKNLGFKTRLHLFSIKHKIPIQVEGLIKKIFQ